MLVFVILMKCKTDIVVAAASQTFHKVFFASNPLQHQPDSSERDENEFFPDAKKDVQIFSGLSPSLGCVSRGPCRTTGLYKTDGERKEGERDVAPERLERREVREHGKQLSSSLPPPDFIDNWVIV